MPKDRSQSNNPSPRIVTGVVCIVASFCLGYGARSLPHDASFKIEESFPTRRDLSAPGDTRDDLPRRQSASMGKSRYSPEIQVLQARNESIIFPDSDWDELATIQIVSRLAQMNLLEIEDFVEHLAKVESGEIEIVMAPRSFERLFKSALHRLAQLDPEKALGYVLPPSAQATDGKCAVVFSSIANENLDLAESYLACVDETLRPGAVISVISAAQGSDPVRALKILNDSGIEGASDLRSALLNHISETDPEMAMELAADLALEGGDKHPMRGLLESPSGEAREMARIWLDGRDNEGSGLTEDILDSKINDDPLGVLTSLPGLAATLSEKDFEVLVRRLTDSMAVKGPDAAFEAVREIGSPHLRDLASAHLAGNIAKDRPELAQKIVNEISDANYQDKAIDLITSNRARDDLKNAIDWARQISDPNLRDRAVFEAASSWKDRGAAISAWKEYSEAK